MKKELKTLHISHLKKIKVYFFLISTLIICSFLQLQAQQFKSYYNSNNSLKKKYSDSIFKSYKKAFTQASLKKDTIKIVNNLINLSIYKRNNLDYDDAFNDAGDALFLAEEYGNYLLQAKAFEELGALTYLYKQDDEAGYNFKKAHYYFKKLYKNKKIEAKQLYKSYYNLALYSQRKQNIKHLKLYIDSCNLLKHKLKNNEIYDVFLDEKRATFEGWQGQTLQSITLLKKSVSTLENLDVTKLNHRISKSFLLILYGRIGVIYMAMGELDLAKSYFNKSVTSEDICGEGIFYKAFIYEKLANLLAAQKNYKKAFEYREKANVIYNTYLNPRNDKNQGFLTIRNRYKDQLNKKNALLNKQSLELAEQRQETLRLRIFFFIILFTFVVLFFLVRSRIKTLKYQKKEEDSKALLDVKNSELTTSTLQLIEREEVIKMLSDHVKKNNLDKGTRTLLKSIEKRSVSLWDAFNNRFISQNEGFYERLQDKAPNLSAADLKICALIKLNFSGKEMAYLLGISLGSVHVARHRLRKKMNLSRDVNLTNFINSI
ncbi:hypothetical protein GCM10022291_30850 [Postechiella marina]|uniref:HTH luxR-type domain-containing protein n=1 Tax=Postechiella marina TaxID=943941 RepID=A0ABP8CG09_9FLAO